MRSLHILFRLEERKYSATEDKALAVPFLQALDYLAVNDVPIQICSKRKSPPTIHPTRHAQNRISWLVFIIVPSLNLKPVPSYMEVDKQRSDWANPAITSAMFDHLINIVVVSLRASNAEGHNRFNLKLYCEHTPFYLTVFNWVSVASHFHKSSQRIVGMPGYFKMAEQERNEGMELMQAFVILSSGRHTDILSI